MPASRIVDEQEVLRWFREGRSYAWMSQQYRDRYNVTMTPAAWGNFRKRRGLDPRTIHDGDLVPWQVREEHRHKFPARMLRVEGRLRAGEPVSDVEEAKRNRFIARLRERDEVVAYMPDEYPEDGFVYLPREDTDTDIIRRPAAALTTVTDHHG